MDFAKAKTIVGKSGKPLENIELKPENADDENVDTEDLGSPDDIYNICTHQHAVDYDADGDLDLVVGCFGNRLYLYKNIGGGKANEFADKPVELPIKTPGGHSAPHFVDFDGDGDLDLLTGSEDGGLFIAMNDGSRQKPKYGKFKVILEAGEGGWMNKQRRKSLTLGSATRVWATDFNGDGLLDLIVGDSVNCADPAEGVSEEEWKKQVAKIEKLSNRMGARRLALERAGREFTEEFDEKFWDLVFKTEEDREKYEEFVMLGNVWVLIQKPNRKDTSKANSGDAKNSVSESKTEEATKREFVFENKHFDRPELVMVATRPLASKISFPSPALFDVDNDGKAEMVIGSISGEVQYAENTAGPGEKPVWSDCRPVKTAKGEPLVLNNW